ncbi:MAG TPA: hypothetical protein VL970_14490 [Candidatus Acidoferrales bacterium]|nr:hypothetical protein [Candidatus Acidoferrales bacterium]
MNVERTNRGSAAATGFLVVSAIFAVVAAGVKLSQTVPPVDADRGAERSKDLAEIRAAEEQALNHAGVIDAQRGIVRLPIATAMELAARTWQKPAAARADLNARAEKAAAELPKPPEKPNPFE